MPGMSANFRERGEQFRKLAEYQEAQRLAELTGYVDAVVSGYLTGAVESRPVVIEAPARETQPHGGITRHGVYCVGLTGPVVAAIGAAAIGDMRLFAILCLVVGWMALVGLLVLDGPA